MSDPIVVASPTVTTVTTVPADPTSDGPTAPVVTTITTAPDAARLTSPLSPNTTKEEDITTAGQRRINIMWERTQSTIALFVVFVSLSVGAYLAVMTGKEVPTLFSLTLGTVIGFYFARTNHAAIGGTGVKAVDSQKYEGR